MLHIHSSSIHCSNIYLSSPSKGQYENCSCINLSITLAGAIQHLRYTAGYNKRASSLGSFWVKVKKTWSIRFSSDWIACCLLYKRKEKYIVFPWQYKKTVFMWYWYRYFSNRFICLDLEKIQQWWVDFYVILFLCILPKNY